jgi:hypothetical protein
LRTFGFRLMAVWAMDCLGVYCGGRTWAGRCCTAVCIMGRDKNGDRRRAGDVVDGDEVCDVADIACGLPLSHAPQPRFSLSLSPVPPPQQTLQLLPSLLAYYYFRLLNGRWPYGERSHGIIGCFAAARLTDCLALFARVPA